MEGSLFGDFDDLDTLGERAMGAISLEQVSRRFDADRWGVRELDLEVREGELLVIVGATGCGKTTALRLIAGLETPTSGEVRFAGRSVGGVAPGKRDVAFVFQSPALQPHLRVRGVLEFGLHWREERGLNSRAERGEANRMEVVVDQFGLRPLLDREVETLSGGERQRVAIGRALMRPANVYLLDEPLSSLDGPLRVETRRRIGELQRRWKLTIVYVTHDQAEALSLADRVAVMADGRIEQINTPENVYNRPANRRVASFLSGPGISFLEGRMVRLDEARRFKNPDGTLACAGIAAAEYSEVALGIRAENVALRDEKLTEAAPGWSAWESIGEVARTEFLGDRRLVSVRWKSGAEVVALIKPDVEWKPGDRTRLLFKTDRMMWFDEDRRLI